MMQAFLKVNGRVWDPKGKWEWNGSGLLVVFRRRFLTTTPPKERKRVDKIRGRQARELQATKEEEEVKTRSELARRKIQDEEYLQS